MMNHDNSSISVQETKCLCYSTKITYLSKKSLSCKSVLKKEFFKIPTVKEIIFVVIIKLVIGGSLATYFQEKKQRNCNITSFWLERFFRFQWKPLTIKFLTNFRWWKRNRRSKSRVQRLILRYVERRYVIYFQVFKKESFSKFTAEIYLKVTD